MEKLTLLTTLLTLVAVLFYAGYRGLQFYREITRPPMPTGGEASRPVQPGKQVTTFSLTVVREVIPPQVSPAVPKLPSNRS